MALQIKMDYMGVKIIHHIAKDIKNEIFTKVIQQKLKLFIANDEA